MPDIKIQKLLYHLTDIRNISSILDCGLKPRAMSVHFHDVANSEILNKRQLLGLDNYVPFHWFSRNPFAGGVQEDRPDDEFGIVTVERTVAARNNWKVIPRHPLATEEFQLLDYNDGIKSIDWDAMNARNYHDPVSKSVCMAECLSPKLVSASLFFKIYVPNDDAAKYVEKHICRCQLNLEAQVNKAMFL